MKYVLIKFGFDETWIARIMFCVQSVFFSVLLNGSPLEVFQATRGSVKAIGFHLIFSLCVQRYCRLQFITIYQWANIEVFRLIIGHQRYLI